MRTANTTVQGMFLFQGFVSEYDASGADNMGQIEIAQYLAPWAERINRYLEELATLNWAFPGVYEYEVTEEFGAWLALNPNADDGQAWSQLIDLTVAFIDQGSQS